MVFILFCCHQNNVNKTDGVTEIDVINNLGKYQMIAVSDFVSELEYIPLETGGDCLVGENIKDIIVTTQYIFVTGSVGSGSFCYTFRRDGSFMGKIGSVGQGPGEYKFITRLSIDENNSSLYLEASRTLLEYSLDGVFRQSINLPTNTGYLGVECVYPLNNHLFVGHIPNDRGKEEYNFILFNDSGQVIKGFDNYMKFERADNWISGYDGAMKPFKVKQNIYLKEFTNDTLYCMNEKNELIPQFVFNLGKYVFTKDMKENFSSLTSSINDVIIIPDPASGAHPMVGTPNHIFFNVSGGWGSIPRPTGRKISIYADGQSVDIERAIPLGIYDITNKKTFFLDSDPVSGMLGFFNDLDGGLSFWPRYYTPDNELVDVWQAYEMKEYLTDEYFSAHEMKNPQSHQKLKELLKNLDKEDNPVVVIAKLK